MHVSQVPEGPPGWIDQPLLRKLGLGRQLLDAKESVAVTSTRSTLARVPREQLSRQRAWLGLSSYMPIHSNHQCWGNGEDGATDRQGLLWLPEAANRRQSGMEDQREDGLNEASLGRLQYCQRCSWRSLLCPCRPGRVENAVRARLGLLGQAGWQGLLHLLAPICGFTTAVGPGFFFFTLRQGLTVYPQLI